MEGNVQIYGYGVGYGNAGALLRPCLTGLDYWSSIYNVDYSKLLDKSTNGNDAAITSIPVMQFDEVSYIEDDWLIGLSVLSSVGISTPSITGNILNFTLGYLKSIELSDGNVYEFQETSGADIYSSVDSGYRMAMNVFKTIPTIDENGIYEFIDQSDYTNNIKISNLQSMGVTAGLNTSISTPAIDFTGIDTVTYKSRLIWDSTGVVYPLLFGGNSASSAGFYCRLTTTVIQLGVGNGVANQIVNKAYSGFSQPTNGDMFDLEINFTLNGNLTAKVNGVEVSNTAIVLGGDFGIDALRRIAYQPLTTDREFSYMELVGYFKLHFKEGLGQVIYDVSGNINHATAIADQLDWNSFKGNTSMEYINGFTDNAGVVVLGLDDLTADAQGNAIQYPVNSGINQALSMNYEIPVNTYVNEYIPSGTYTYAQLEALAASGNIAKLQPTTETIKNLIIKTQSIDAVTQGVLTFIIDDINTSDSEVYDIFKEFGYLPSFSLFGANINGTVMPFYQQAYSDGCSMLAHSMTHPNMSNSSILTDQQASDEMTDSKALIETYGITVNGWVTPMSSLKEAWLPLVQSNFNYGYTGLNAGVFTRKLNPARMNRYSVQVDVVGTNIDLFKDRINTAIATNQFLAMYMHELNGIMTPVVLRSMLQYIKDMEIKTNVKMLSADNAFQKYYGL